MVNVSGAWLTYATSFVTQEMCPHSRLGAGLSLCHGAIFQTVSPAMLVLLARNGARNGSIPLLGV